MKEKEVVKKKYLTASFFYCIMCKVVCLPAGIDRIGLVYFKTTEMLVKRFRWKDLSGNRYYLTSTVSS